jgi:hypothetical protein
VNIYSVWWLWCFAGGFANLRCANVVFLRGKRGAIVVVCVAKGDGNSPAEKWDTFLNFIFS